MHGVLKVKTTEEQARARKEEKERKLKIFRAATQTIFTSRSSKKPASDVLPMLEDVLQKVPDWNTLWNFRREIFIVLRSQTDLNGDFSVLCDEDYQKLLLRELDLTRRCLLENPKSYATWHHRCWVMNNIPKPDWTREIELCDYALSLDERNFHCWDYRRFVVKSAGLQIAQEFEFTNKKLAANFSNYSSWHYRSALLTEMASHDNEGEDVCLNDTILQDELNLVHNAVFTDPSDQSPWFYYQWLIGRSSQRAKVREIFISRIIKRLVVILAKPEDKSVISGLHLSIKVLKNTEVVDHWLQDASIDSQENMMLNGDSSIEWVSALKGDVSSVWWINLPKEFLCDGRRIEVILRPERNNQAEWCCKLEPESNNSLVRVSLDSHRMFNLNSLVDKDILCCELEVIKELYELEPNNKWVLLTYLSLLRSTDPIDTMPESCKILKKLTSVDPLRNNYYIDLESRYKIENEVINIYQSSKRSLDLPNSNLTTLFCLEWMPLLTTIDLSNNSITVLPCECAYLICVTDFNVDNNQISNLEPLRNLPLLNELKIKNNCITTFSDLEPVLSCPVLRRLEITGNMVVKLNDFSARVAEHPSSKSQSHSLTIIYKKDI